MIPYTVKRSRRKTCTLQILSDGTVEVRAPMTFPNRVIQAFIAEKTPWIIAHQERMIHRREKRAAWDPLTDGLPLLGEIHSVRTAPQSEVSFDGSRFTLPEGPWAEVQRPAVERFYRQLARHTLLPRLEEWAARMGESPSAKHITGAKTRWGSCSGRNSINLSWRLMLVPPACVDYVLVHELCHLSHHDHSPAFWQAVGRVLPDWSARRDLLRQWERRLADQDW